METLKPEIRGGARPEVVPPERMVEEPLKAPPRAEKRAKPAILEEAVAKEPSIVELVGEEKLTKTEPVTQEVI